MIRETITQLGQRYQDVPVYETISRAQRGALEVNGAMNEMAQRRAHVFGTAPEAAPQMQGRPLRSVIREQTGHDRVRLNWLTPDANGNLVNRG